MKINCSKYNEVRLQDVEKLLTNCEQFRTNRFRKGRYLGSVVVNKISFPLFAGDEVLIHNVSLSLSYGEDSYFDCELEIN